LGKHAIMLSYYHDITPRYPYAIVGIDLASMIWDMLERRVLYPHLYKTAPPISLQHVMELFCEYEVLCMCGVHYAAIF